MDGTITPQLWTLAALFAFNLPVLIAGWIVLSNKQGLIDAVAESLKEKDGDGRTTPTAGGDANVPNDAGGANGANDGGGPDMPTTSFSRVTGFLGTAILASLFWTLSNVVIGYSILNPSQIAVVLNGSGKIFLIGSALFVPYAFNQLKSIF